MSEHETNLPAITDADLRASGLPPLMEMSPGLAIFFNDALYNRCKNIAVHMSKAEGMTPRHLLGKPEACFAVVSRAIVWKLDPFAVAMATYQTPGGSIGYMGTLIQAILENSGRLEGGVTFKHEGDWTKVQNKFNIKESAKGGKYPAPSWTSDDAKGLYVVVSAKLKGELEPRTLAFYLVEAFPLNSPLWATAPSRQICYTAVRAFANLATPSLLLGIPFDIDPTGLGDEMRDITPQPTKSEFARNHRDDPKVQEWTTKLNFATTESDIVKIHDAAVKEISPDFHARWNEQCDDRLAAVRQSAEKAAAQQKQTAEDGPTGGAQVDDGQQQDDSQDDPNNAEIQTHITEPPAEEGPSDEDLVHHWGDRLAAAKDVKDVADVRAEGLKALPAHLHARWNDGCDARSKTIAEKPRDKNGSAKPKAAKAAADSEKETPFQRGKRLLPRVDTAEDIEELRNSIMEELSTKGAKIEWEDLCMTRLKEVTAP